MKKLLFLAIIILSFTSCATYTYEKPSYLDASIDFSVLTDDGLYVNNNSYCPYPYVAKEQVAVVFRSGRLPKGSFDENSYVFTDITKHILFGDSYIPNFSKDKWGNNYEIGLTKKEIDKTTVPVIPTFTDALIYIKKKINDSDADGIIELRFEKVDNNDFILKSTTINDYFGNRFIVTGTIIKFIE